MNNEFTMSLTGNFSGTPDKVGLTTTVKQQVDNIQITIDHFKKCIDVQRKQQNQLENQLSNLQKTTQSNLSNMLGQISLHSKQLLDCFKLGTNKQNKEIEYLELQKKVLEEQQQKLYELSGSLGQRVRRMQQVVGL